LDVSAKSGENPLAQWQPSVVLLIEGWPGFGEKFVAGRWHSACDPEFVRKFSADLAETIEILRSTGTVVALTTSAPAMVDKQAEIQGTTGDYERLRNRSRASSVCQNRVRRAVAATTGASIIDLEERICPNGSCVREEQGVKLRPDGLHYFGPGGDIVANWLLSEIAKLPGTPNPTDPVAGGP
jgi:hypothetical protein